MKQIPGLYRFSFGHGVKHKPTNKQTYERIWESLSSIVYECHMGSIRSFVERVLVSIKEKIDVLYWIIDQSFRDSRGRGGLGIINIFCTCCEVRS